MNNTYIQQSTAGTGTTVTCQDTGQNVLVVHNTAGIATLTLALPATPIDGQVIRFSSGGGIVTLTVTSAFAGSTIIGAVATVATGTAQEFTYVKNTNIWYKTI